MDTHDMLTHLRAKLSIVEDEYESLTLAIETIEKELSIEAMEKEIKIKMQIDHPYHLDELAYDYIKKCNRACLTSEIVRALITVSKCKDGCAENDLSFVLTKAMAFKREKFVFSVKDTRWALKEWIDQGERMRKDLFGDEE